MPLNTPRRENILSCIGYFTSTFCLLLKTTWTNLQILLSVLSMIKPRNLVLLILVFIELGAIIWIFLSFCFFVKNCIKCVLLQFSVKRLLWNQLVISVITELILFLNSSGLVFDIMLISSANSIGLANLRMLKEIFICTGCPRRNVPDFRRVFLMLKYTDITQNTYVYPKLNCYGDNGQRSLKLWQLLHTYWLPNTY